MSPDWRELYEPGPVPRWLEAFEKDARREAVEALLWQRFHHGSYQVAEPQDLLADWARDLGSQLVRPLDRELAAWVERHWGAFPDDVSAARLADAWSIVADAVAWSDGLKETAKTLREKFGVAAEYLGLLSTSASRDPLGRFYGAVAAHQQNRDLAPFWWRLAELPEGTPNHHARYALEGLRGLPAPEGELETGYRPESVQVLGRLARGLARRAAADPGNRSRYERRFLAFGRLHLRSLPLPGHWKKDLGRELASRKGETEWLLKLVPELKPSPVERPADSWRDRRPQILQNLRKRHESALVATENLLDEQRRYAQTTGEADEFLVRTLCNFAKAIWRWRPDQAVAWTREALDWAPWDATVWTTLVKTLLYGKRPAAAVEVGWQARERFPENAVVRTNLAEALKAAGRLESAAAVYRETVELFPSDDVARNGLADTLKAQGDYEAAAAVYRGTVELFPSDDVARNGLAETLKARGDYESAAATYRETIELFPSDVVALAGLAGVRVAQGDLESAEALYREVLEMEPSDLVAKTGLRNLERLRTASEVAELRPAPYGGRGPQPVELAPEAGEARTFRRRARTAEGDEAIRLRRRAAEVIDAVLEERPHEPRALVEQVLLALDKGDAAGARLLLDGPASRLAGASALLAAVSRLEREEARAEERTLDDDSLQEVLDGPNRLRNLDPSAYAPLVHLQEGRALLALGGEAKRLEITARHLDRLRAWAAAQPKGAGDFAGWWAERVAEQALDGKATQAEIDAGDVEVLEAWQRDRDPELDLLEEDYCLRQAALRTEPRLPTS